MDFPAGNTLKEHLINSSSSISIGAVAIWDSPVFFTILITAFDFALIFFW